MSPAPKQLCYLSFSLCLILLISGCDNMRNNNRLKPYEKSELFTNESSARVLVAGTVARGHLKEDDHLYRGITDGKLTDTFPFPITREVLLEGQERYNIYCAVCHDEVGYGRGMVVRRGFKEPPSFHEDRLRAAPAGHLFNVMTNGFGAMSSYAAELTARERWAVAAYIKTLQRSQNTPVSELPREVIQKLEHSETYIPKEDDNHHETH